MVWWFSGMCVKEASSAGSVLLWSAIMDLAKNEEWW